MTVPTPGWLELEAAADQPFSQALQVLNQEQGTALNLTGFSFEAQLWDEARTTAAGSFSISTAAAASGELTLQLTPEQVQALPSMSWWDLLVSYPGGEQRYWLEGTLALAAP